MVMKQQAQMEAERLATLKDAERRLARAQGDLQEFANRNFRVVSGGLIYFSNQQRDELDTELRRLTVAVDTARTVFHQACAEWAQFKT